MEEEEQKKKKEVEEEEDDDEDDEEKKKKKKKKFRINRNVLYLHCLKKGPTCKLSVTLSNLNRFSKFLHCWKAYKIRYKTNTKLPTSP